MPVLIKKFFIIKNFQNILKTLSKYDIIKGKKEYV